MITSLLSAGGGLSETLTGKGEISYLEAGGICLLNKKVGSIELALVTPKDVERSKSEEVLSVLAKEFVDKFGSDRDKIQKRVIRGEKKGFPEFASHVTELFVDKFGSSAYFQFREVVENLYSELDSKGAELDEIASYFTPVQVPVLKDEKVVEKQKGFSEKLLKLCNGENSTREIAEKLDVSRAKVMRVLSKFNKSNAVGFTTRFKFEL